jgi:hypothetical protein
MGIRREGNYVVKRKGLKLYDHSLSQAWTENGTDADEEKLPGYRRVTADEAIFRFHEQDY